MLEAAGGAVIAETGGEAGQEVELGSGLAQEQGTAVGGGGRAAEVGNHKSAMVCFVLRDADLYTFRFASSQGAADSPAASMPAINPGRCWRTR